MHYENQVVLNNPERVKELKSEGPDGPIFMVNLLKFKDKAEYEDGRETDLTGEQAYDVYSKDVTELLRSLGGDITFSGDVTWLFLGEVEELWDRVAIARYPNRATLVEMMKSLRMAEIAVHRKAGLKGQLNIETVNPGGREE